MKARRPKMPARLRKSIYERDGYACLNCGWSPGRPDGYDGKHPIRVATGTERRIAFIKRSWTDAPDQYFYREHTLYLVLEVDHIVPLSAGGPFGDPANLQTLCSKCNNRKGATVA